MSGRQALHLARRFAGSLWPAGPPAGDEAWAASVLSDEEHRLWRRMSRVDRRHAVGVGRRVEHAMGAAETPRWVLAAALLHDVGKVPSCLGTLGRVAATVAGLAGRTPGGRMGLYLSHAQVGADMLESAGSDPLTVAWAREHHLPAGCWSVPPAVGEVLKAADDD